MGSRLPLTNKPRHETNHQEHETRLLACGSSEPSIPDNLASNYLTNNKSKKMKTDYSNRTGSRTRLRAGAGAIAPTLLALFLGSSWLRGDLQIAIERLGTNVLLTWTNPTAQLEQTLTVTGAGTTVTGAVSPRPVEATDAASFFRLRLPVGGPFDARYVAPTFTTGIGDPAGGCGCTAPQNPNSLATAGNPQDNGLGSVFLHTGELTQQAVDLAIPGRGMDWKFERRYRSGMNYDGPLGQGWDFNYNRRLAVPANGDVLRVDGLGRADRYVFSGGSYQSPSGFYTRLLRNGDGSFDEWDRHGTVNRTHRRTHWESPGSPASATATAIG